MIREVLKIDNPEDYEGLQESIPESYLSTDIVRLFKESLSPAVRSVVVEYPYVDKDYRSTYYQFYAKRHRTYDKF
jgi:hypothetical protein